MNLLLPVAVQIATLIFCDAQDIVFLNGSLAETNYLPLKLECAKPNVYVYVGSITFNGTMMSQTQTTAATDECVKQSEEQSGKGGSVITCFLTFGSTFSIDASSMVRAVYKCLASKPEKMLGGIDWEKGGKNSMVLLTSKPNSKGKLKFKCPKRKSLVEVVKILLEGKEIKTNLQKYREFVKRSCYVSSAKNIGKSSKVPLDCSVQLDEENAYKMEIQYRCEEPPINFSTEFGETIIA